MSVGEGLVWSTVIILLFFTVYQLFIRHTHILLAVVGISIVVSAAAWGWRTYQERPSATFALKKIQLGMTPVEVLLRLGNPESEASEGDQQRWVYDDLSVQFLGLAADSVQVFSICTSDSYANVLTLGVYDSEDQVLEKLGGPTGESIHEIGLSKLISYPQWNAAYEITRGSISQACVFDSEHSQGLQYQEEYTRGTP